MARKTQTSTANQEARRKAAEIMAAEIAMTQHKQEALTLAFELQAQREKIDQELGAALHTLIEFGFSNQILSKQLGITTREIHKLVKPHKTSDNTSDEKQQSDQKQGKNL